MGNSLSSYNNITLDIPDRTYTIPDKTVIFTLLPQFQLTACPPLIPTRAHVWRVPAWRGVSMVQDTLTLISYTCLSIVISQLHNWQSQWGHKSPTSRQSTKKR